MRRPKSASPTIPTFRASNVSFTYNPSFSRPVSTTDGTGTTMCLGADWPLGGLQLQQDSNPLVCSAIPTPTTSSAASLRIQEGVQLDARRHQPPQLATLRGE